MKKMTPHNAWIIYYNAFQIFLVLCIVQPMSTLSTKREITSVCVEGSMKSDPKDCASYFQCLNGKIVNQKCHNGSYFDAAWEVCVIDALGVCKPQNGNCTEGVLEQNPRNSCGYLKCWNGILLEMNCTRGNYFNSTLKSCLIDKNGVCSAVSGNCTEGEIKVNPTDPCGYLKCWNGILVKLNCTNGNYFNSTSKSCLVDKNGVCSSTYQKCTEGEMKVNPADPCGYLRCWGGILLPANCPSGSYFNSTLGACLIDENGICSALPGTCTEGELKINPEDPCGYLQCKNGSLAERNCPIGSYFNSTLKICLIDQTGICSALPGTCTEGELKINPEDPCGYMRCVNRSFVEVSCVDGSYFNSTLKICLIDENGVCSSITKNCSEGAIEKNPDDPCGYLECVNRSLVEVNCADGNYFHSTLLTCLIDETGVCSSVSGSCLEGQIEEDPDECGGYLQCVNGEMINQLCSYGHYFHTILKSCVVDTDGICTSFIGKCKEGDRQTDPEDCAAYLVCKNGEFKSEKCEEGKYFESSIGKCIIDENCVCIPMLD